jgi:hypothetical protein
MREGAVVRELKKPDFQVGITWWSNANYLPESFNSKLKTSLKKCRGLSQEQADSFLARCNEIAQEVSLKRPLYQDANTRKELKSIAPRARSLMQALGKITPCRTDFGRSACGLFERA